MADLEHTPDFATVTWRGHQFTFSPLQREAVRMLIERRGKALSQNHILTEIESDSKSLRQVFKSKNRSVHPAWGTLIELPPQHHLGRGLYRVPSEIPSGSPAVPRSMNDPSFSGSSTDDKRKGEQDMVSRLPTDPSDLDAWLDGEIPALCSDLIAERNFTRVLLRWGAIRQRASKDKIRAAADRFEAENLVAGLHYAVQAASESESLTWLDGQLRGLADAWSPGASTQSTATCRDIFLPGYEEDGPDDLDLYHGSGLVAQWIEDGNTEHLHDAHEFVGGPFGIEGDSEQSIVIRMLESLRNWSGDQKGAVELAAALEARDSARAWALHLDLAFPGVRQINEVWDQ